MNFIGQYTLKQYRNRKLINKIVQKNGIVDVGLDYALAVAFQGYSQSSSWYCGLIDSAGYSGLSDDDYMSSHSGWTELTAYNESARQAWAPVGLGNQIILNTSPAVFTINATKTLRGIFIVDDSTKGGSTGTLWSTASVSSLSLTSGDIVRVQYQLQALG